MASLREGLEGNSLSELADMVAAQSTYAAPAQAEILRRQTTAQLDAAEAQRRGGEAQWEAAQAAKDTARYTLLNARYLLASVVVLALSSALTLVFTAWSFCIANPNKWLCHF